MASNSSVILLQCNDCLEYFQTFETFNKHLCPKEKENVPVKENIPASGSGECVIENNVAGPSGFGSQSQEKKRNWSPEMTMAIIALFKEHKEKFSSVEYTKKKVFQIIAEGMKSLGYDEMTGEMCADKWKNMMRTYKGIVDRKKKSGEAAYTCPYYDAMDEVLGKDPNIRPPVVYRSSESGPSYRDDILETQESASPVLQQTPQQSMHQHPYRQSNPVTGTPKPRKRKELPFSTKEYIREIKNIERERNIRREEAAQRRADERQRRHDNRERRHAELLSVQREFLELLRSHNSKNS